MDIVSIFKGKRVALVGNHPNQESDNLSAYDLIARVNNYQPGLETNVYFFSFKARVGFQDRLAPVNICVSNPYEKEDQKEIFETSEVSNLRIIGKSEEEWNHILGINPTSSFRAMYFLWCMDVKQAYITGFPFDMQQEVAWLAYNTEKYTYDKYIAKKLEEEWKR